MGCSPCNSCNACDHCQALCQISSDAIPSNGGNFNWPTTPAKDVPICKVWTAAAWESLKSHISSALAKGSKCNSGQAGYKNSMISVNPGDIITKDIYESARNTLKQFGLSGKEAVKGGIITYDYATMLKSQYDGGKIYSKACNKCNTTCDVCVSCQGCNHCNTCQSDNN